MKLAIGLLLFGLSLFANAQNAHRIGFVKIRHDRELYVDYLPAAPGQPLLVVLNGLTYDLTDYKQMMPFLTGHNYGILRYDPFGMGQTLLHYGAVDKEITVESQSADLDLLLTALHVDQPVFMMGLSYGGGLALDFAALYPQRVRQLILMSSFVSPRNSAPSNQDQIIKQEIQQTRLLNPFCPLTDDQLYDYFFHLLVYQTYPSAEPSVLENPYKLEATYRLADGIRKLYTDDLVPKWSPRLIHMMIGANDEYVPRQMADDFWNNLKPEQRLSRIVIANSTHKMPEVIPAFSSAWINEIIADNPALQNGNTFQGDAKTGKVSGPGLDTVLAKDKPPVQLK